MDMLIVVIGLVLALFPAMSQGATPDIRVSELREDVTILSFKTMTGVTVTDACQRGEWVDFKGRPLTTAGCVDYAAVMGCVALQKEGGHSWPHARTDCTTNESIETMLKVSPHFGSSGGEWVRSHFPKLVGGELLRAFLEERQGQQPAMVIAPTVPPPQVAQLQEQIRDLTEQLGTLTRENQKLSERLSQERANEPDRTAADARIETLEQEVATLTRTNEALEERNSELEQQLKERVVPSAGGSSVTGGTVAQGTDAAVLAEENAQLKSQVATLTEQLNDQWSSFWAHLLIVALIIGTPVLLAFLLGARRKNGASDKNSLIPAERSRNEKDEHADELRKKDAQIVLLETHLERNKKYRRWAVLLAREARSTSRELSALPAEKDRLASELSKEQAEISRLADQNCGLKSEIAKLRDELREFTPGTVVLVQIPGSGLKIPLELSEVQHKFASPVKGDSVLRETVFVHLAEEPEKIKELKWTENVHWDYEKVREAITAAVKKQS